MEIWSWLELEMKLRAALGSEEDSREGWKVKVTVTSAVFLVLIFQYPTDGCFLRHVKKKDVS